VSPFQEVDHTADWALRVWAPTLKELFVDAARGMYNLAGASVKPGSVIRRKVELSAPDYESLLVNWLQELLFYTESEERVFTEFQINELNSTRLSAEISGGPTERLDKVIKAVTFHDLKIVRDAEGYQITIVFDV
jgi:SHS2 domain-containing protein